MRKARTTGFTIVELLIVIVVLAILAAISFVAYNGIQQRALDSRLGTGIDLYVRALKLYKADHGVYPNYNFSCLTANGTLPAGDGFPENECNLGFGDTISSELNAVLSAYVSPLPANVIPPVPYVDSGYEAVMRSAIYHRYNGENYVRGRIFYMLPENRECPRGEKGSWAVGAVVCEIELN